MPLVDTIRRVWRGLCTNWIGTAGVVLTTSAFVLFSLSEVLLISGAITNAYVGLISYLALPALFVLGLLLIPIGWWLYRRREKRSTAEALQERFDAELVKPKIGGSRMFRVIAILTVANIIFLGAAAGRMLHFMDQPSFCGTACHSVMGPEWATYQDSPHARVRCVDCHVGQSAEAAVDAKLNGLWQMISVTFDLYERPIPTPVHNLRPARETCERCHWPSAVYGDRIKRFVHFDQDRGSTRRYSTLSLKVGSGRGERRGEIHWHVAAKNEVRYKAGPSRTTMRWVEVRQKDGSYRRYNNRKADDSVRQIRSVRVLDCVDCHNRATHIYQQPEEVVDALLADGNIDRSLPFAKRQALGALTGSYRQGDALAGIARDFRGYYRRHHHKVLIAKDREIDRAIKALQTAYRRNIHPEMNVDWNVYPDHRGHRHGPGCRRCHNPDMIDADGKAVPNECTLCHSILAYDSERPFEFLQPLEQDQRERKMGDYLRREFLRRQLDDDPKPKATASLLKDSEPDPFQLMKGESIGKLKISLPAARVVALLGEPSKRSAITLEPASGDHVQTWSYPRRGLSIVMGSAGEKGKQSINAITAKAPCKLDTRRGIRIGSSASEVRRLYGADEDKERLDTNQSFVAGSIYGGMLFKLKGEKVTEIFLGAAAE